MKFKSAVVTACLSVLFLSSLRNCPAGSFVNSQSGPSCCTEKEQTSCPTHKEGTKGILLCCDQPRITIVSDISSFRFDALHSYPLLAIHNHYVYPEHLSSKTLPDISLIGPPQAFERSLSIRAPPV